MIVSPDNLVDTNVQDLVASNPMPTTFHGDALLFGTNLASMTAFFCLGVMVVGWMTIAILAHLKHDKPLHPITIYRAGWWCAGMALTMRAGTAAASLWAWDPKAAKTAAAVLTIQRYLDPLSLTFAAGWLSLLALTYPAMCIQLRKAPYPVQMLARLPALKIPLAVVGMSVVAAALVAWLRAQAGL